MRFERCLISRQGLFDGLEIRFSEGINTVSGRNGSGKTLLARTMMECAWKPSGSSSLIDPAGAGEIYSEVTFSFESGEKFKAVQNHNKYYRIDREDGREPVVLFRDPSVNENDDSDRDKLYAPLKKMYDRVPSWLMEQISYCASATDDQKNNITGYEAVKKIFLDDHSGFYPYIALFSNSENKSHLLNRIKDNEATIKDISRKTQIIEIQNSRRSKLTSELEKIQKEIEELTADAENISSKILVLKSVITDLDSLSELNRELSAVKEEVEGERKKHESMTAIKNDIERLFPQFRHLDCDDSEYLDSLQKIFIEIRNINERIENYRQASTDKKALAVRAAIAIDAASAGAAIFSVIEYQAQPDKRNIIILSAVALAILVTAAAFIFHKLFPRKSELSGLLSEKENVENRLKAILEKGRFQVEGYRLSELYEFLLQYFEDYIEYVDINLELKNLSHEIKDDDYIDSTGKKLSDLYSREKELKEKIINMLSAVGQSPDFNLDAASIEHLINIENGNLAALIIECDNKKSIKTQLEEEIVQCRDITDEYQSLMSMSAGLNLEMAELKKRLVAIEMISSSFNSAASRRENTLVKKLTRRVHETFHTVTENQQISVVDDSAIERTIRRGELPEGLNLSLVHLLLLTIKICLSDFLIDSNMSLPLIIDEPFDFLDSLRLDRMRKIIEETALKRQIIILTRREGTEDWGNYIQLK